QLEIVSTATVKMPVINCFIIVVIFYSLLVFLFINVFYFLFHFHIGPFTYNIVTNLIKDS
ncbi:MAG: hypothetical protein ACN6PN_22440, partial [Sphingobacterium sp.]